MPINGSIVSFSRAAPDQNVLIKFNYAFNPEVVCEGMSKTWEKAFKLVTAFFAVKTSFQWKADFLLIFVLISFDISWVVKEEVVI